MIYDVLGIMASWVTAFGTIAIPIILLILGYRRKKKRKTEKVIDVCAYEFLTSFIIPYDRLYDYFFQFTYKCGDGSFDVAINNLKEKKIIEVRKELQDNELNWEFPFYEKHIAVLGKTFPEKLGNIYDFVRRARMLGRIQQAIIMELSEQAVLGHETSADGAEDEKNKGNSEEEIFNAATENGSTSMTDMKCYLKRIDDQNIQLILVQMKELKDAIAALPCEMGIEEKKRRIEKI